MKNPLYKVGDQVYLKTSAAIGFMEPYYIAQIFTAGTNWQYKISIRKKPAQEQTVGDANDLRSLQPFIIDEVDLITACEASTLAVNVLRSRLKKAEMINQMLCGGGTDGP